MKQLETVDPVWDRLFECLAHDGRLQRYFRLPQHERLALMKVHSGKGPCDLLTMFSLLQEEGVNEKRVSCFLDELGDYRVFALMLMLNRSIKVWRKSSYVLGQSVDH